MISIIRFGSAILAAGLLSAGLSAPAFASVTPGVPVTGDTLYVLPWNQADSSPQLYSVDPTSGVTTAVGATGPGKPYNYYWAGTSYDATTGKYYVSDNNVGLLWSVDPETGVYTQELQMTYNGSNFNNAYALAIAADGTTYLSDGGWGLYQLDRTTGVATQIGTTFGLGLATLAIDPTSGKLYGGGGNAFAEITPGATATFSPITTNFGVGAQAMQFDSNGTLWFAGDGRLICSADILNTTAAADCSPSMTGYANQPYSILIASAPAFTVTFDANGGTGTMADQTSSAEATLTANTFTRTGHTFVGWSTSETGSVEFADQANYPFTTSTTLYAQWTADGPSLPNTGLDGSIYLAFGVTLALLGGSVLMIHRRITH